MRLTSAHLCFFSLTLALAGGCDTPTDGHGGESHLGTVTGALTVQDCMDGADAKKVLVCHATSSATTPYVLINIAVKACEQAHVDHAGDTLPDANGDCCAESERDCNNVCGGTATADCAGVCGGTATVDCAGVCEGTAVTGANGGCCQPTELDCAGVCGGGATEDCAGVCGGGAVVDCAGVCDGGAVTDCAGVCGGTAVTGTGGGCCQPTEQDCAGVCGGTATEDCAGVCNGGAFLGADVYFTTYGGVFVWSSETGTVAQINTFPSYAIALSPSGGIVVGTGGVEWSAEQGSSSTDGVYAIDAGTGAATLISSIVAEDLQYDPSGALYAANSTGIYELAGGTQVSTNPTSQFAFEGPDSVVTTNGTAYASIFGNGNHRIDLLTDTTTTLVGGSGGEDIRVVPGGAIWLSGQGGVFEVSGGSLAKVFPLAPLASYGVYTFDVTSYGEIFTGNPVDYSTFGWLVGLRSGTLDAPQTGQVLDAAAEVNSLVLSERCIAP